MNSPHQDLRTPPPSRGGSASVSTALSDASEVAVSGRNKGIQAIDLAQVFSADDARVLALITSFDLSHNEMEVLSNLEQMVALRKLNVSYNRIGRISGLPFALTQLNLSHNRLGHLDGVSHLPHLRELDVSFNRLTSLVGLTTRQPLEVLHVDDNRLVSTAGLEDMAQLRILTMSNNFVSSSDELVFLSSTPSLQILNMQNNPVAQHNGFRSLVGRLQMAVLSLDGAPLLRSLDASESRPAAGGRSPAVTKSDASRSPHRRRQFSPSAHRLSSQAASDRVAPSPGLRSAQRGRPAATAADSSSPSAHLVTTPSAHKPRRTKADISVDSEAPIANATAPEPMAPSHSSSESRAQSTTMVDEDDRPSTRTVTPAGRGSYARQFAASQQQQQQQAQHRRRQPSLTIHAPWTQASSTCDRAVASVLGASARSREAPAQTVPSPPPPPLAAATVPSSQAQSPPQPQEPATLLVRPAEVQMEDAQLAQLHDSLVAQALLKKENEQLRATVKRLEGQLADSRRVVSDQLAELSRTRLERDALRQSEEELKARCERAKRATKMQEGHHRDEILTLQSQYERVKTFYEAEMADLRRQLASELRRSRQTSALPDSQPPVPTPAPAQPERKPAQPATSHTPTVGLGAHDDDTASQRKAHEGEDTVGANKTETRSAYSAAENGAPREKHRVVRFQSEPAPAPLHAFSLLSPRTARRASSVDGVSPVSEVSQAVPPAVLARQLKGWLYTEMATDAGHAQEDAILAQLRSSVEAEEADRTNAPRQTTDARALLEAFVSRQLSAAPEENTKTETGRGRGELRSGVTAAVHSHAQAEVPSAGVDVSDHSPDARPQQLPSPPTAADPSTAASGLSTPSPLPLPLPNAVFSAPVDEHAQALRDAESFLGAAAHSLRLNVAGSTVTPPVYVDTHDEL